MAFEIQELIRIFVYDLNLKIEIVMTPQTSLTADDRKQICKAYRELLTMTADILQVNDIKNVRSIFKIAEENTDLDKYKAKTFPALLHSLQVARIVVDEIGLGRSSLISAVLYEVLQNADVPSSKIRELFGETTEIICSGLVKVKELYGKQSAVENDNFRKLLFTFAKDVRVILVILADRLNLMRHMKSFCEEEQKSISAEVSYLYAPLAHRMGLYGIKSEMEDLSLKYMNREIYDSIAGKLNETKRSREEYIDSFIAPLRKALAETGMKFEMKGRTKTISSIYNKLKKKHVELENIYDLFAIRIIIDCDPKDEKAECWRAYSIVTDMYKPNPVRLKDWISVPKSNGYESLHITVFGPKDRWVEVQIRTKRMDEIAEKGFCAHWKYKGIKTEANMELWLANIREVLENPELNSVDFIEDFKLNLYDKEVFAFTPKGDLRRLAKGATVLDFAFDIHTKVGCHCTGGIVNDKNVSLRYVLQNGDTVSVLTNPHQEPKQDWMNYVVTARAKTKLRQALREQTFKQAEIGKELLDRRLKNWKLEIDDATQRLLMKEYGYKDINVFFSAVGEEKITATEIKDFLDRLAHEKQLLTEQTRTTTVEGFHANDREEKEHSKSVLVLDKGLTDIDFSLAHCCNPIFGDPVFAFVSATGGVKIHRIGCHNEAEMRRKYGYRIMDAKWSGEQGQAMPVMLHVSGNDDIGIMSNISQLFAAEKDVKLRNINVDSTEGGFDGSITVLVNNAKSLDAIIKKVKAIKGVRKVERLETR